MTNIDEELGALYRAARDQEAPTRADRVAVRRALASALVVTTGAASAHAAAGSVAATQTVKAITAGKIAAWLFVGAALGGVTSSAAWVLTSPEPSAVPSISTPHAASAKASAARSGPGAPVSPIASAPAPDPEATLEGASRLPGSPGGAAPVRERERERERAASTAAPALTPPPSLAAEGEGLLAIQRALANGDAPGALKMLGEQDARFHGGALSEERAVVRVLAWCAAGQPEQARAARDRFFSTYPRSPHAKRVQNSCAK